MHVGRCFGDISKRWRSEFAHIRCNPSELFNARMPLRVSTLSVGVVEASIVKAELWKWHAAMLDVIGKVKSSVAVVTLHLFAKK